MNFDYMIMCDLYVLGLLLRLQNGQHWVAAL